VSSQNQRSFAGGEIAPSLYARADQVKYQTGARTLRNFMVMRHGGVQNRPGTGFTGEVKDSTKTVRLIQFVFNAEQTYALEFGDLYLRVIRNQAYVTDLTLTITAISNASPGVVTYVGTDPVNGEEVFISGVVGPMANFINGRNFKIANVNAGANTFQLQDMTGANFDTTSLGAYTSGGTAERIYTVVTPYLEADLPDIRFAQSADVVTLTHPSYETRELSRTGHAAWTLSTIAFAPGIPRPTGCAGTGSAGAGDARYKITAVDAETREESLAGKSTVSNTISNITQANPAVLTYVGADNFLNGDIVTLTGVLGMTQVNGFEFEVANVNVGANTFELRGIDSTGYSAYTGDGVVNICSITIVSASAPSSAVPNNLSWTLVSGASEYNIYRDSNGVFGFIGVAGSSTFTDTGITPDTDQTPPIPRNPFNATGKFPSCVTYYQQRRVFANTDQEPEQVFGSRTGQFTNFTKSDPIQDDDAVTFKMAGRQVNEVQHLVELAKLVVLTSGGEWIIGGDSAGVLTPFAINAQQQSYNGASNLAPILINGSALYVQARGSIVRDIGFDYQVDGYRGNDLTIFSAHLFDGFTMRDWAYQQVPHSIVWMVRSDGKLLGLTYIRDQEMIGWHRHDFDGEVEQVCSIPEGTEDALYIVIKRTINGVVKRYVERVKTRAITDVVDSVFVDCSLTYDGTNATATTMTLTGGTLWTPEEILTLTASAPFFTAADVGNEIRIESATGEIVRCVITAFGSTTVVSVTPHMNVPANLQAVARATWVRAVDQVTGLWHLEGKTISALGDGFVAANPNNGAYTVVTVTNGVASFDEVYGVIHVGLPFTSDLQTLDIETAQGETLSDKKKLVNRVTLFVEKARGIWIGGAEPPADDDFEDQLTEFKQRSDEDYDEPVEPVTDTIDINIKGEWNSNGRIFVRQTDPLPLAVLAVVPAGMIPYNNRG
jgi:hypothetical protein